MEYKYCIKMLSKYVKFLFHLPRMTYIIKIIEDLKFIEVNMSDINFSTVKQTLFNIVAGGGFTFAVGALGVHAVRFFQGQSIRGIASDHPLMACVKLAAISVPLFYLYKQ